MSAEKYKEAWREFKDEMAFLRKKRLEILTSISKKFDLQQLESLRKKLNLHE